MSFTRGYFCQEHGPIEKAASKTIKGVKNMVCHCGRVVTKWEKPLKERAGYCSHCAGSSFTLAMHKGDLLRCCKGCEQVINPDTNEIIRRGVL